MPTGTTIVALYNNGAHANGEKAVLDLLADHVSLADFYITVGYM